MIKKIKKAEVSRRCKNKNEYKITESWLKKNVMNKVRGSEWKKKCAKVKNWTE